MPVGVLPPAQPKYILRGHCSPIHALHFSLDNSRLFTADADGWVVSWSLAYKRPVAAWKAHDNAVLGLASWGQSRIISHGRDSQLFVWKLGAEDEKALQKILPVDHPTGNAEKPEVILSLSVNTLNFCSFAWCWDERRYGAETGSLLTAKDVPDDRPILLAVPNTLDSDAVRHPY
jgi:WD40 repeat protein